MALKYDPDRKQFIHEDAATLAQERVWEAVRKESDIARKTPINGIQVPSEYVTLAMYWHAGQDDILYAVCSSGNLLTGTRRPWNDDENRACTDEEWYLGLWDDLDCSLRRLVRSLEARKSTDADLGNLKAFQAYAEKISDQLRTEYDLD